MVRPLLLATTLLLSACAGHLQQKESDLQQAGFRSINPSTPAQIARLRALPQGKITQVTRKGKTLFMLADARRNLLLVGGNPQFEKYQGLLYKRVDKEQAEEKLIKLDDAAWGPWDGMYGPFGDPFFGPMMLY